MKDYDIGYLLGYLCARGSIVIDEKNGNYYLCFRKPPDNVRRKIIEVYGKASVLKREVRVYGKTIVTTTIKMVRGWNLWSVPKICFGNRDFRIGFLRGFFDERAYIRYRERVTRNKKCRQWSIRVDDVNHRGLVGIKRLLELEGIKSILFKVKNRWRLEIDGKTWVTIFLKKVGFENKEKEAKLQQLLGLVI